MVKVSEGNFGGNGSSPSCASVISWFCEEENNFYATLAYINHFIFAGCFGNIPGT